VTWDATAWRPGLTPAGKRVTPWAGTLGLAPWAWHPGPGTLGLAPWLAPQAGAGPESEAPVCGADWVTMSDSCHTERRRISDTRESQAGRGRQTSQNACASGLPGICV
jgi:hypothetical protein